MSKDALSVRGQVDDRNVQMAYDSPVEDYRLEKSGSYIH